MGHAAGAEFATVQGKNITALFDYRGSINATMLIPIAMKKQRDIEPSMLQDLKCGKPCKIDAINGIVCHEGRKYGIATPINDRIVEVVKELQEGKRQACGENVGVFDGIL